MCAEDDEIAADLVRDAEDLVTGRFRVLQPVFRALGQVGNESLAELVF
jgi:hypothetical protein